MSKESIQEVVQKSLEDYFNDLGEQQPSNIYDMTWYFSARGGYWP